MVEVHSQLKKCQKCWAPGRERAQHGKTAPPHGGKSLLPSARLQIVTRLNVSVKWLVSLLLCSRTDGSFLLESNQSVFCQLNFVITCRVKTRDQLHRHSESSLHSLPWLSILDSSSTKESLTIHTLVEDKPLAVAMLAHVLSSRFVSQTVAWLTPCDSLCVVFKEFSALFWNVFLLFSPSLVWLPVFWSLSRCVSPAAL